MNITHNFTTQKSTENVLAGQPVAAMPLELAKKLLANYAKHLQYATSSAIITNLIEELHKCAMDGNVDGAIVASLDWIAERELVHNILNEKWDAYEVKTEEQKWEKSSAIH